MALPTKHTKLNTIEELDTFYNGGKGSGNFGHAGRPGEVGGSSSENTSVVSKQTRDRFRENVDFDYQKVWDALDEISRLKGGSSETEGRLRNIEGRIREIKSLLSEMRESQVSDEESVYDVLELAEQVNDNVQDIKRIAGDDFGFDNWKAITDNLDDYADGLEDFLLNKVEFRWVNGGKGSGNFGHSGRPGKVGGSGKGGFTSKYKEGDIFEKDGHTFTVEEGPNGLEGVSDDRKIVTMLPDQLTHERKKLIDKIIGKEKVRQGETKAEDDANFRKFERDIDKIQTILSKEKSRENFGQEEIRKLKDKYSDYMSGNWSVTGRFQTRIRQFQDWADNYQNY